MCIPLKKKNSSITIFEIIPTMYLIWNLRWKSPRALLFLEALFFLNQGTVSFNLENHQQAGFSRTSRTLQTTAGLLSRVTACILPKPWSWWGETPPDICRVTLFHINHTTQCIRHIKHQSTPWEQEAFALKLKGLSKGIWLANKGKDLKIEDTRFFFLPNLVIFLLRHC